MVGKKFLFLFLFCTTLPLFHNDVSARPMAKEPDYEQMRLVTAIVGHLESLYHGLQNYKKKCNSYPKTRQGFAPLELLGRNFNCPKQAEIDAAIKAKKFPPELDPMGKTYKYVSDGKTFKLEGFLGYSASDSSISHGGEHWDNPRPLPTLPPLRDDLPNGTVE